MNLDPIAPRPTATPLPSPFPTPDRALFQNAPTIAIPTMPSPMPAPTPLGTLAPELPGIYVADEPELSPLESFFDLSGDAMDALKSGVDGIRRGYQLETGRPVAEFFGGLVERPVLQSPGPVSRHLASDLADLKGASRVFGIAGTLFDIGQVAASDRPANEAIKVSGKAVGAWAGAETGALLGGAACAGSILAAPVTPLCAVVGGVVGSIGGGYATESLTESILPSFAEYLDPLNENIVAFENEAVRYFDESFESFSESFANGLDAVQTGVGSFFDTLSEFGATAFDTFAE